MGATEAAGAPAAVPSAIAPVPTCKVVLAGGIAKSLLQEVKEGLSKLEKSPKLVGFLANDDPAAQMYADWSAKTCIEK
jgi:methylenetetrahydrofolate dehydrogenase (NAD+)